MKNLRTIILAAGKGTRMKSDLPKVLHPLCGKPMVQYIFDIVQYVGSLKNCIVLGHKYEMVQDVTPQDYKTVIQKKLLGTADAVKCCERHFKNYSGDVLILCGDTPLLKKEVIRKLVKKHKKEKAECTLLTTVVHDPQGYGRIIRGDKGVVLAIREEKDATEFEKNIVEINTGVYCFNSKELFKAIKQIKINAKKKEFYLTDVIEVFVDHGLWVSALETEESVDGLGVNSRVDLAFAESVLRERILTQFMMEGVTITDPKTTYVGADVKIGRDTTIQPFTVIENNVRIGKKCSIGPFCRLRPGTRIADRAVVGNFTEISRSHLGKKSVMKHFGFLGDARVGMNVNIGAGAVTANYDGQKKSISTISDKAFIGSDSILIAPVRVGKEAVTGAGCVVPKGKVIPNKGVVVGVPGRILKRRKSS